MEILSVNELLSMSKDPNWLDSYKQPAILLELTASDPGVETLGAWLQDQSLPTIAIASSVDAESLSFIDMLVRDGPTAADLFNNISTHPAAAAVLVEVVRVSPGLTIRSALAVESLGYSTLQQGEDYLGWLQNRPEPQLSDIPNPIIVERNDNELSVTLNSPANRNAISVAMRDALAEIFQLVVIDDSIQMAHVYGNGPDFCAGGDLKEFGLSIDAAMAHQVRMRRMPGQFVAMAPEKFHFHLHGACIGAGIEMPAFAHRVTATSDTRFRLPEVGFGLIPGAGGCVSIPRRVGKHRMNRLAISGETIDASTALDWGLIDEIESA